MDEKQYDEQGNGKHYNDRREGFNTWDMIVKIWGKEAAMTHSEISAFEYRMRMGKKPNQPLDQELLKARWYEKKAETLTKELKEHDVIRDSVVNPDLSKLGENPLKQFNPFGESNEIPDAHDTSNIYKEFLKWKSETGGTHDEYYKKTGKIPFTGFMPKL